MEQQANVHSDSALPEQKLSQHIAPLSLKQMTAHLRKRIKQAGIKARIDMMGATIRVFPPTYGIEFTDDQQRAIRQLAVSNRLTWVRNLPIDVEQMTNPHSFHFYFYDAAPVAACQHLWVGSGASCGQCGAAVGARGL